jgi:CheY-like chemotaxis protein
MGGELYVKSTVGKGSTFWFELDLPEVSEWTVTKASPAQSIIGYTPLEVFKILVVDDKEDNRAVLVDLLRPLGFDVVEAVDGGDGLQKATVFQPDLILMDLLIPVMDGFEAIRQIRNSPELHQIKIIAVSATVTQSVRQKALVAGCDGFLAKPVQMHELFDIVKTQLELDWIYETVPEPVEGHILSRVEGFVAPPPTEAEVLYKLAVGGDILGLREQLEKLEQLDKRYSPFVQEIRGLLKLFQVDKIRDRVKQYMEEE